MYLGAELVLRSYVPDSIEPGMFFMVRNELGENVYPPMVWQLPAVINAPLEEVVRMLGYPVALYIIDYGDAVLARPEQIGWYDEGDHTEDLRDIELKDINDILQDHDGFVEIDIDELAEIYGATNVTLEQGKVIIRAL